MLSYCLLPLSQKGTFGDKLSKMWQALCLLHFQELGLCIFLLGQKNILIFNKMLLKIIRNQISKCKWCMYTKYQLYVQYWTGIETMPSLFLFFQKTDFCIGKEWIENFTWDSSCVCGIRKVPFPLTQCRKRVVGSDCSPGTDESDEAETWWVH